MIISIKRIKKPRKQRICESCKKIMYSQQMRMYGAGDRYDPPYVIYTHSEKDCMGGGCKSDREKIEKALKHE